MGALAWTIYRPEHMVVIRGFGVFDISFATAFRETMRAEGAAGFCKLFDLSRAHIHLSNLDIQTMVASTRLRGPIQSGPIAICLGKTPPPLLVDMAILLKERIGHRRRMRLFTDESLARRWLAAEGPAVNPPPALIQLPSRHTMSVSLRR
ncbi:hypothetical protein [Reyranella sp.]|uniref:hypothetical protein n=1 Tax=Reyranella sp. TaxID=1929291 RepID=UPI003D108266